MSIPQFKRNLRKLIQRNGMTVLELSEKSDTLHAQIYNYLNPNKYVSPNATTLERLADALGVTMDELYRGDL